MAPATAPGAASTSPIRNRLLAAPAPDDLSRLRPHLEPAAPGMGKGLTEPGRPIAHVLFPEVGIVSVLAVVPDKRRRIEARMIGREGMVGLAAVLGTDAELHETTVQADGRGWRLPSDALRRAVRTARRCTGCCCATCRPSWPRPRTRCWPTPRAGWTSAWRAGC